MITGRTSEEPMAPHEQSSDHITTTIGDGVATIVLDRPAALNALTARCSIALAEVLDGWPSTMPSGDRADRGRPGLQRRRRPQGAGRAAPRRRQVGDVLDVPARAVTSRLATIPKLVVAKVNGFCFTGALELVLACDLAIAAETAKLGDTHAKFGLRPTWGMSQRLVATVGITRAREFSYTARTFTGSDAAAWGLVTRAVPADALDQAVVDLIAELRENSMGSLAAYKDLYRTSLDVGLSAGLEYEAGTDYAIADTESRIADFR